MTIRLRRKLKGTNVRQFTIYLPDELDQRLRQMASENARTLSKQTELIIVAGLQFLSRKQVA